MRRPPDVSKKFSLLRFLKKRSHSLRRQYSARANAAHFATIGPAPKSPVHDTAFGEVLHHPVFFGDDLPHITPHIAIAFDDPERRSLEREPARRDASSPAASPRRAASPPARRGSSKSPNETPRSDPRTPRRSPRKPLATDLREPKSRPAAPEASRRRRRQRRDRDRRLTSFLLCWRDTSRSRPSTGGPLSLSLARSLVRERMCARRRRSLGQAADGPWIEWERALSLVLFSFPFAERERVAARDRKENILSLVLTLERYTVPCWSSRWWWLAGG